MSQPALVGSKSYRVPLTFAEVDMVGVGDVTAAENERPSTLAGWMERPAWPLAFLWLVACMERDIESAEQAQVIDEWDLHWKRYGSVATNQRAGDQVVLNEGLGGALGPVSPLVDFSEQLWFIEQMSDAFIEHL